MNYTHDYTVRPPMYVCKCVRLLDGFPSIFPYIGYWLGWKRIDPDATVLKWRAV